MSHCEFQPRLSAWYDGELDADEARLVEGHVEAGCPVCTADLGAMRALTAGVVAATRLSHIEESVGDLHGVIRRETDAAPARSDLWRTVVVLTGLAASILVVSATWLVELRPAAPAGVDARSLPAMDGGGGGGGGGGPALALSSDWETVATTLRADPRPELLADSPLEPRYADAIDWLLQNLAPAGGRGASEGQTWAKPGS